MKTEKRRKGKGDQVPVKRSIGKRQKSVKSLGDQFHKTKVGKEVLVSSCGNSPSDNSDKQTSPESSSKMPSDIKLKEEQIFCPSAKIKLQLFPLDERIRKGLEQDGHNPFLELTLRPRKKISSVLEHLCNKWGRSSVAIGELVLFPFNVMVNNLVNYKRWTLSDIGICARDVHSAVGSPDIFRLRYGWVSTQPNSLTSYPALGCTDPGYLKRNSCSTMETIASTEFQTEVKSTQLEPCITNNEKKVAVEHTISAEPHMVPLMNQTEEENNDLKANLTSTVQDGTAPEGKVSVDPFAHEEQRVHDDLSFTTLLWSDLSNMSIGGLLSEASFQGRFSSQETKKGSGRVAPQPTALISDSLDAFIEQQLKCPQASSTHSPNTSSSIFDAENTCHSFAFPKDSSSSKDFLTLGRSPFSGLSNQDVGSRPFKCTKAEANAHDSVTGGKAVQEPKTDPLLSSAGLFNNENSLGFSKIRWDDSLGQFDLPLTLRQIIKEDSISIGHIVR